MAIQRSHFDFNFSKSKGQDSFILLKPSKLSNPGKLARALVLYKGVKEVLITSGDYGLIVLTAAASKARITSLQRRISKQIGFMKIQSATKHLSYKRI
ncbi:MAG TPA: hypothetical protein VNF06_00585 [Candidatus Aquilonibacter sp.]|nr:hypothetical protein [Candidatus Aquilonibacter sp.]